jgi:hypothetical protein
MTALVILKVLNNVARMDLSLVQVRSGAVLAPPTRVHLRSCPCCIRPASPRFVASDTIACARRGASLLTSSLSSSSSSQDVLGESGMQLEFHHTLDTLLSHIAGAAADADGLMEALIAELLLLIGYYCLQVRLQHTPLRTLCSLRDAGASRAPSQR